MKLRLRSAAFIITVVALGCPLQAAQVVDAGNSIYRVVIDDVDLINRTSQAGLFTAYTGPSHPLSASLNRPGEVLTMGRWWVDGPGYGDTNMFSVRSWSTNTDYPLGTAWSLNYFETPTPGFECYDTFSLVGPPVVEPLWVAGEAVGARATWSVTQGNDDLIAVETLRAWGNDEIDGFVEIELTLTNAAMSPTDLGIRLILNPRLTPSLQPLDPGGVCGTQKLSVVLRPPDPILTPDSQLEWELPNPDAGGWDVFTNVLSTNHCYAKYHAFGMLRSELALAPSPTPPGLLQAVAVDSGRGAAGPQGGVTNTCFEWPVPMPPRDLTRGPCDRTGVVSYWGDRRNNALHLEPGESVTVRQLVAVYTEYPVRVATTGAYEADCVEAAVGVTVAASAALTQPSATPLSHRWSSPDPRVHFADPTQLVTSVTTDGLGVFPLRFVAGVGIFEAVADTTLTVVDVEAPRFERINATPSALWPPNHRMIPVSIDMAVVDECDYSPAIRLVSVVSNEGDNVRRGGDGHTTTDIDGVELGTDDRSVLLRAERQGGQSGRMYTLTYEAEDASGNIATATVDVRVPHDRARVSMPRRPRP